MASASVASSLLDADEPPPVARVNHKRGAAHKFLLIGDHAGRLIPRALDGLGVRAADMDRHIAWDIGVRALGEAMSARLDVPFVHQRYSRLVIDCNRDPARADAMPEVSDGTVIPGNAALTPAQRAARVAAIHTPYQAAIADALEPDTILIALHSFTPRLANGAPRPWQVGILHDRGETRYCRAVLAALQAEPGLCVGDNEPYQMDAIDYSVPRHAYPARPYVEFEVRQDLIADPAGVAEWSERLARILTGALASAP
ncbi:MAG: N-formylglutamate amidohydrolase [Pseudomonadota bacterium]